MQNTQPQLDLRNVRRFIAIPLKREADPSDSFSHPELFHIVEISYDFAVLIEKSEFAKKAFETIDNYPIELFEDPFFESNEVESLLLCLKHWHPEPGSSEENARELVESLLFEAEERNVGIYFKL